MNPAEPALEAGALAESLLLAGDLLDAGVLTTDRHLVIQGWNRWFAAATGLSPAEVVGRPLFDLFPTLPGSAGEAAFHRALNGETVVRAHRFHEYLIPLPAGPAFSEFEFMQQSARVAPLLREGEVVGVIALLEDVTERVAREAELRNAKEAAEAANKAKSDFIAAMSHELRTPLGAIIGYADILAGGISGPISELQGQHIGRVRMGAWHLLGIIEEILTFARIEAGREEVHLEEVRVEVLTREATELVGPQASIKGLSLRLELEDGLPPIRTDAIKLRQILVNLLGNAVKFTEAGEVALAARVDGGCILFRVSDTGPGIPEEHLQRIFEPFTQIDHSLARAKGGTGLGLAVCRQLAEILGGTLAVESSTSAGSVFTLRIPQQTPEEPPASLE